MREIDSLQREHLSQTLGQLGATIIEINTANGWNVIKPSDWADNVYKVPAVLALIHSEVSEALEAYRKDDAENFIEELADVLIRLLDCATGLNMDLGEAVLTKMAVNRARAFRHGGKKV